MSSVPATESAALRDRDGDQTPEPPQPKHRIWLRLLVLLLLVSAGAFAAWRIYTARKQAAAATAARQTAMMNRPTPVQLAPVERKPMPIYLNALGTVTPYNSVTLKARVTGELTQVNFKEGQEVKKGQTLMVIDPRPYQAALDQARGQLAHDQALLKNAQAEFNRYQALFREGVVSKESLDTQESTFGQYQGAIQSDQAAIENAALNLKYCHVISPINGRIGLRLVDAGNVITANTTNLIVINQFQPIAVYFTLPEDQLRRAMEKLVTGKALIAEAYDRSDTDLITTGKLLAADNQIDTTTGTGRLKAVFDNQKETLFPNQFVNVHLILERKPDAIVIPAVALQHGNQGDFVWLFKDDKTVAMQSVLTLLTSGAETIVESGLEPGQMVVVDGADRLRPGSKVEPVRARQRQNTGQRQSGQPAPSPVNANPGSTPPAAEAHRSSHRSSGNR